MNISIYQVDAFADRVFEGNPAAVCPLDEWLPEPQMQFIAAENNLSETAFFVRKDRGFHIRWFTPTNEVDLCGHATLASAYILFEMLKFSGEMICFESRSGELKVTRSGDLLEMDFPLQHVSPCVPPGQLLKAFDAAPLECLRGEDYILVFENEQQIRDAAPDMRALAALDLRGVAITAPASAGSSMPGKYDFVCRFFAPRYGIDEDPVTGSAFTQLVPYWAGKTGRKKFHARQVSARGGDVSCELAGDRVRIAGKAVLYLSGSIDV